MNKKYAFFFDFDSTLICTETLDELALIAGLDHSKKFQIDHLTHLAMEGEIDFGTALSSRIELLNLSHDHILEMTQRVVHLISPSVLRNQDFFVQQDCYIISGGFRDIILPVAHRLGIPTDRVFANDFTIHNARVTGIDLTNPLSKNGGKAQIIQSIHCQKSIIMIGDGMTDAEVKKTLPYTQFYAYTEHISRPKVIELADHIISDIDHLRKIHNL